MVFQKECSRGAFTKYKSDSGMVAVFGKTESKLIDFRLTLHTPALNSNGAPHALEHLIFQGSKTIPFRCLDIILERNGMTFINAYTRIATTTYIFQAASMAGLINAIPYIFQFVFEPLLADECCLTEVYHIKRDGQEGGVLYSELRSVGYSPRMLIREGLRCSLWEGSSPGLASGGLINGVRQLKMQEIKEYHSMYYTLDNTCVICSGAVDCGSILDVISSSILTYRKTADRAPYSMPRPILDDTVHVIELPGKDDTNTVLVLQSNITNTSELEDDERNTALQVLCDILFCGVDSLVTGKLMDAGLVSDGTLALYSVGRYYRGAQFEGVKYVSEFREAFRKELSELNTVPLTTIRARMRGKIVLWKMGLERGDLMVGNSMDAWFTSKSCDSMWSLTRDELLALLMTKDQGYWDTLLAEFCESPFYTLVGHLSGVESNVDKKFISETADRVRDLGEEALGQLGEAYDHAVTYTQRKIPQTIIDGFPTIALGDLTIPLVKTYSNFKYSFCETSPKLQDALNECNIPVMINDVDRSLTRMTVFYQFPKSSDTGTDASDIAAFLMTKLGCKAPVRVGSRVLSPVEFASLESDLLVSPLCEVQAGDPINPGMVKVQASFDPLMARESVECLLSKIDYVVSVNIIQSCVEGVISELESRASSQVVPDSLLKCMAPSNHAMRNHGTNRRIGLMKQFSPEELIAHLKIVKPCLIACDAPADRMEDVLLILRDRFGKAASVLDIDSWIKRDEPYTTVPPNAWVHGQSGNPSGAFIYTGSFMGNQDATRPHVIIEAEFLKSVINGIGGLNAVRASGAAYGLNFVYDSRTQLAGILGVSVTDVTQALQIAIKELNNIAKLATTRAVQDAGFPELDAAMFTCMVRAVQQYSTTLDVATSRLEAVLQGRSIDMANELVKGLISGVDVNGIASISVEVAAVLERALEGNLRNGDLFVMVGGENTLRIVRGLDMNQTYNWLRN